MSTASAINTARWAARIIILIYMPFVLYSWLLSFAVVSQMSAADLGLVYITILLANTLLAIGLICSLWWERLGSKLVTTAVILSALQSPLVYSLFTLGNPGRGLSLFLPGTVWFLSKALVLIPVIILYFCRREEEKVKNQAIS